MEKPSVIIIPTEISEDSEKTDWFIAGYYHTSFPTPLPWWGSNEQMVLRSISKTLYRLWICYQWGRCTRREESHPPSAFHDMDDIMDPHIYDCVDHFANLPNKLGIPFSGYGYGNNN